MDMKKEPAVIFGLLAAVTAALVEIVQAGNATGAGFDVWSAVLVGAPLLAGILTRFAVIPVETVRTAISRARSSGAAVTELADRVDVAVTQRPGNSG